MKQVLELEKEIMSRIIKEEISHLISLAKKTKCYEYLERLIECRTVKDLAELILLLKIIEEGNQEVKEFNDAVRKVYVKILRRHFATA